MEVDLIFVYGTLRREARADVHDRFLGSRAEFLGKGTVQGRLWRVSWYPALTQGVAGERVVGEVYRLTEPTKMITALDEFEVCDLRKPERSEYTREIVPVAMDDGSQNRAWCYFFLGPTDGLDHLESGDYAAGRAADSV